MPMARPLPNVFTIAAECVYNRITDGEVFNAWVKQSLVAALKPGQVVLMEIGRFTNIGERVRPSRRPAVP
jgi:hypothetical protein